MEHSERYWCAGCERIHIDECEFYPLTPREVSGNLLLVTPARELSSSSVMGSPIAGGVALASHPALAQGVGDPNALYALPKNDFTMGELAKMPERFQKKVHVEYNGCWMWTGSKYTPGYGQYRAPMGERMSAHTYAYKFLIGSIPENLEPDHMCGRRACVNPYHLQLVGHGPNCRRRLVSIRKSLRMLREKIDHATGRIGTWRTLQDLDVRGVGEALAQYTSRLGKGNPYQYPHSEKKCAKCGVTKPVSDFHRVRDWSATYDDYWYPCSYCKPCHSARSVYNARLLREKRRAAKECPPSGGAGGAPLRRLLPITMFIPWALLSAGFFLEVLHA